MEVQEILSALEQSLDRMNLAAQAIEQAAERAANSGEAQHIVATTESAREQELEARLEIAERKLAELRAQSGEPAASGRKTLPTATTQLLAKQGLGTLDSLEAGAVDAALSGLSLEQRMAVKAQLLRAGLLG